MGGDEQVIEKPSKSAGKDEWVAYAISQGMSEEEATDSKTTKAMLIEKYANADSGDEASVEDQIEAANEAGEAMTAPDAPAAVKAGAQDLPSHLRAAAVHRAIPEG